MKRAFSIAVVLTALVATVGSASPVYNPKFHAPPGHFTPGELVDIVLVNEGTVPVTMGKVWDLRRSGGDHSATYVWPDDRLELAAGGRRVWRWDQFVNACYGECANVREGDPAPAGRYAVTITLDGYEETARFTLGEHFTLGFEGRPGVEFTVFVGSQPEIDQMRAEAQAQDKSLIVSGIVRKRRAYNADWNFSMGPHSIVLGEFFIEVCDASPFYVQRHKKAWLGQRWCPWSSYVERVGR